MTFRAWVIDMQLLPPMRWAHQKNFKIVNQPIRRVDRDWIILFAICTALSRQPRVWRRTAAQFLAAVTDWFALDSLLVNSTLCVSYDSVKCFSTSTRSRLASPSASGIIATASAAAFLYRRHASSVLWHAVTTVSHQYASLVHSAAPKGKSKGLP